MTQEILYTSAPQGLKPGSQGFCTVVSTKGIPKNLAERLESLSGYRHAYTPPDPRAAQNPVNFSHLIVKVGGQSYHVLSRIADAGLDYTKRTNKLAHHVALEPNETVLGGPAWVLKDRAFCVDRFDGTPKVLPTGRTPRAEDCPFGICTKWGEVTKDPGWAGVLAEHALNSNGRPISIIFRPDMPVPVLDLVVEALSLLPTPKRWEVTFNTYFTSSGLDCQWRFLLDGTAEARTARANPHAPLIDLCSPLQRAKGGELVEAARSGKPVRGLDAGPQRGAVGAFSTRPKAQAGPFRADDAGLLEEPIDMSDVYAVSSGPPPRPPAPTSAPAPTPAYLKAPEVWTPPQRDSRSRSILLFAGVGVLFIVGLLAAFYVGTRVQVRKPSDELAAKPKPAASSIRRPAKESTPKPDVSAGQQDEEPEKPGGASVSADGGPPPSPPPKQDGKTDSKPETPANAAAPEKKEEPKRDEPRALDDIRKKKGVLALPPRTQSVKFGDSPGSLATILVPPGKECELSLEGDENVLDLDTVKFQMERKKGDDRTNTWAVMSEQEDAFKQKKRFAVGRFSLRGQSLAFHWDAGVKDSQQPDSLFFHLLRVQVGSDSESCVLIKPHKEQKPLDFPWEGALPVKLEVPAPKPLKTDCLRLDVRLEGFPTPKGKDPTGVKPGDSGRIPFQSPSGGVPVAELVVEFRAADGKDGKDLSLFIKPVTHVPGEQEETIIHRRNSARQIEEQCSANQDKKQKDLDTAKGIFDSVSASLARARKQLDDANKKGAAGNQDGYKATDLIKQLEAKLPGAKAGYDRAKHELDRVNKAVHWATKFREFCDTLTKGTIHYRIYAQIGGRQAVLAQTQGFGGK